MPNLRLTHRIPIALASVALAVAACGGGSTPSPSGAASGAPSSSPAASAGASAAASASPSAAASSGTASAAPSIDVTGAAEALQDIDSYKMTISSDAGSFEAVVIRQPEPARAITITNGSDVTRIVIIGDKAWLDEGSGSYTEVPAAMVTAFTGMFDPLLLVGSADAWSSGWAVVGTEEKNGVQARHLHVDSTTLGGAVTGFPAGASVDIWVAEAGYLVAWETSGLGADSKIQISNVNDPTNKVEAPG
jgi:hypothetical protein